MDASSGRKRLTRAIATAMDLLDDEGLNVIALNAEAHIHAHITYERATGRSLHRDATREIRRRAEAKRPEWQAPLPREAD